MKKIRIVISALAVIVCSCSKEQDARLLISNQDTNVVSFKAFFEGEDPETKLGINTSSGVLNWADGDAIAVQMTDDTFIPFTYSSSTKEFSATLGAKEVKDGGVAYYPASIALDGTPGSVNLPTSYTIGADATVCPPMIATVNLGAKSLSLKHLGGILSVKVSYVPADANKLVLTVPGKTVTGTFAVTDDEDDYISAGTGNSTVTLNFTKGVFSTSAREFFIPVPVTTFTGGFTADFKNADNETLYTHSTAKTSITAARASIKRMAELTVPRYIYVQASPSSWSATGENFVNWSNVYVHGFTAKNYNGKSTFYSWKDAATLMTGSTYTHNSHSYYRMPVPADFNSADDVKLIFHDGSGDDYNRYNYNTVFSTNQDNFFTLKEDTTGPYKLYFVNQTNETSGSDDDNVKDNAHIWVYVWETSNSTPISPITKWDDKPNLDGLTYENLHDDVWVPYFEVPKATNLGLIFIGKEQTQDLTSYDSNVTRKHVFYLKKLYQNGYHDIYHCTRPSVTVTKD